MIIIDLSYTYTSGRYPAAQPWTVDRADRFHEINKVIWFFFLFNERWNDFLVSGEHDLQFWSNHPENTELLLLFFFILKKIATHYILFLVYAFKNVIFKIRKKNKNKNKMYGLILITHHNYVTGINSLVTCKTWFLRFQNVYHFNFKKSNK